ncbi:uncharacterized protein LOC119668717 [Teleopsis dalmanni]|uniref:uncharacterized protein LOC119668717 n=1 Tax=Teleopsis dalmanni TaxID=139649 RepID=UPI0018CFC56A|nr:uncharacterized protein LOC119668717 [Teleopsis dalmanni]
MRPNYFFCDHELLPENLLVEFVICVFNRKCLYDPAFEQFYDGDQTNRAWAEIADQFDSTIEIVNHTWQVIYAKHFEQYAEGIRFGRVSSWYLMKYLGFLNKAMFQYKMDLLTSVNASTEHSVIQQSMSDGTIMEQLKCQNERQEVFDEHQELYEKKRRLF